MTKYTKNGIDHCSFEADVYFNENIYSGGFSGFCDSGPIYNSEFSGNIEENTLATSNIKGFGGANKFETKR